MAGAPRSARGARGPPGGAARSRIARVFRRADPQRDRPAPGPAARHREDAVADRPGEAGGGVGARKGLAGMTDWLGMAAHRQPRRGELRARVVARALASRRRGAWLGAAAVLAFLVGGGGAFWAYRTIGALTGERDRLAAQVEALHDTVATFIHGPATRVIQIPVSTGGRVGAVTIFADSLRHRWLVRCDGLAPNAPDQAYQLWFITRDGMKSAALMPMDTDQPMVMALDMPRAGAGAGVVEGVMGAALSIEPRAGSTAPPRPMVFHLLL